MMEHVSQITFHTNISPNVFSVMLKWKTITNHPVRTIPKSNIEIIAPNTQVHDRSLSRLGTGTLAKRESEVKEATWVQTSHINAYVSMGFLDRTVSTQVTSLDISPSGFSIIKLLLQGKIAIINSDKALYAK